MELKRVLFLCIGNSCRSQMAEGFAARYGRDVLQAASAGLAPASIVQPLTRKVMEAKNIDISHQYPKDLGSMDLSAFDIIVNMSGRKLPVTAAKEVLDWKIEDPIGKEESVYVAVRDKIEMQVMGLILALRQKSQLPRPRRINKRTLLTPTAE